MFGARASRLLGWAIALSRYAILAGGIRGSEGRPLAAAPVVTGSASRTRSHSEAHLSAQHPSSSPQARLPSSHVGPRWSLDHQVTPSPRSPPSVCLIDAITDRADFRALRSSRCRGASGPVAVVVMERPSADRAAVAFALPRRVGSAVTRNRVRRRLREICRDLTQSGELPVGSYLFTTRGDCTQIRFTTLRGHVLTAVQRANGAA
jgi:ribonuclease P protein component